MIDTVKSFLKIQLQQKNILLCQNGMFLSKFLCNKVVGNVMPLDEVGLLSSNHKWHFDFEVVSQNLGDDFVSSYEHGEILPIVQHLKFLKILGDHFHNTVHNVF